MSQKPRSFHAAIGESIRHTVYLLTFRILTWLDELREWSYQTLWLPITDHLISLFNSFVEPPYRFSAVFNAGISWLKSRWKHWFWERNFLRNLILFTLAAFIANFLCVNQSLHFIFQAISQIPGLLQSSDFLGIAIFCVAVIIVFTLAKRCIKSKRIRFFLFSLLGFLVVINIGWFTNWLDQPVVDIIVDKNTTNHITNRIVIENTIHSLLSQPLNWSQILTFANLFQLLAVILLGILLYLLIRLLSQSAGIDILPFDVSALESSLESRDEYNLLNSGRAIADLLAAELHRIHHLHNFIEDGKLQLIQTSSPLLRVCREDLDLCLFKGENLEKSLTQVGSIPITDKATLQLGEILLTLKQLWPSGSVQIITGSLHKHGSKLHLAARCEQTYHQSGIHAYEVDQTEMDQIEGDQNKTDGLVPSMVKNLAYRIALDLSSTALTTSNWEAFKFFTEAISHFYRHERTKGQQSLYELNRAFKCCKKANEKDKDYQKVGDLLSLISFSYLNKDHSQDAKESLEKALEINPRSSYIHASCGNMYYLLGQYEEARNHYKYAQELDPTRPALYVRTGCVYLVSFHPLGNYSEARRQAYRQARKDFWYALNLEPNNNAAQSLLAWLDFLCHLEEKKQNHNLKAQIYLNKAFNRLARISQAKKSYIDYSNLAIFFLYKDNDEKAYEHWWKALQLCSDITPDASIYDRLHRIFYQLLTALSIKEINQGITALDKILTNHKFPYIRVIEDLLWDAEIILKKCIDLDQIREEIKQEIFINHTFCLNLTIIESCAISEKHRVLGTAMRKFIDVLNHHLLTHLTRCN